MPHFTIAECCATLLGNTTHYAIILHLSFTGPHCTVQCKTIASHYCTYPNATLPMRNYTLLYRATLYQNTISQYLTWLHNRRTLFYQTSHHSTNTSPTKPNLTLPCQYWTARNYTTPLLHVTSLNSAWRCNTAASRHTAKHNATIPLPYNMSYRQSTQNNTITRQYFTKQTILHPTLPSLFW